MILYCLCSYGFARSETNVCCLTFRSLIAQILRKNRDLLPHVYDNFVKIGATPSVGKTRELLKSLLGAIPSTFMVLDGLDECEAVHQRQLLTELSNLPLPDQSRKPDRLSLKILICSRETKDILGKLKKVPQVSLNDEQRLVSRDIAKFTRDSLLELRGRFENAVVDEVEEGIVNKADGKPAFIYKSLTDFHLGMFLWVQLVLNMLLEQHSAHDLRMTLKRLPAGLPAV